MTVAKAAVVTVVKAASVVVADSTYPLHRIKEIINDLEALENVTAEKNKVP